MWSSSKDGPARCPSVTFNLYDCKSLKATPNTHTHSPVIGVRYGDAEVVGVVSLRLLNVPLQVCNLGRLCNRYDLDCFGQAHTVASANR